MEVTRHSYNDSAGLSVYGWLLSGLITPSVILVVVSVEEGRLEKLGEAVRMIILLYWQGDI